MNTVESLSTVSLDTLSTFDGTTENRIQLFLRNTRAIGFIWLSGNGRRPGNIPPSGEASIVSWDLGKTHPRWRLMMKTLHKLASLTALLALFTFGAMAQTASLEGEVKGEDGKPLKDA